MIGTAHFCFCILYIPYYVRKLNNKSVFFFEKNVKFKEKAMMSFISIFVHSVHFIGKFSFTVASCWAISIFSSFNWFSNDSIVLRKSAPSIENDANNRLHRNVTSDIVSDTHIFYVEHLICVKTMISDNWFMLVLFSIKLRIQYSLIPDFVRICCVFFLLFIYQISAI